MTSQAVIKAFRRSAKLLAMNIVAVIKAIRKPAELLAVNIVTVIRATRKPFAIAFSLALTIQLFEYWGWLASPEGILLDFFLAKVPSVRASSSPVPIVTLEIDDEAYSDCFIYSPMDPHSIGPLLQMAAKAGPAVIGVDIITDSPDSDDKIAYIALEHLPLENGFSRRNVVWAAGIERSSMDEGESFREWLTGSRSIAIEPTAVLGRTPNGGNSFVWGVPIYPREEDLHLRRFPRRAVVPPGDARLSWASRIAKIYRCKDNTNDCSFDESDEELFISSATRQDLRPYSMSKLFKCTPKAHHIFEVTPLEFTPEYKSFLQDATGAAIVLIGGTFRASRDFYNTPEGSRTPGLYVNAFAIQAELAGGFISEFRPVYRFVLDMGLGMLIAACFGAHLFPSTSLNWRIGVSLFGLLGVTVLSAVVLYIFKLVWLSCIGIAIGMVFHLLIELWREHLVVTGNGGGPDLGGARE